MGVVETIPPFNKQDIPQNAFEEDAPAPINPILALWREIRLPDPTIGNTESEIRHSKRRLAMLLQASQYYTDGHFSLAMSELRYIVQDYKIARHTIHISAVESVIAHCEQCAQSKIGEVTIIKSSDLIAS